MWNMSLYIADNYLFEVRQISEGDILVPQKIGIPVFSKNDNNITQVYSDNLSAQHT